MSEEMNKVTPQYDGVQYYIVSYDADLQEGRGFKKQGLLVVNVRLNHKDFAEHWCYERFGNRIGFIMGVQSSNCITPRWKIEPTYSYMLKSYEVLDQIVG